MRTVTCAPQDFDRWMRNHGPKNDEPAPAGPGAGPYQPDKIQPQRSGKKVYVIYTNDDGEAELFQMDETDARRIKEIVDGMRDANGEIRPEIYDGENEKIAEETYNILGRSKSIKTFGHLNTGDTEDWYFSDHSDRSTDIDPHRP